MSRAPMTNIFFSHNKIVLQFRRTEYVQLVTHRDTLQCIVLDHVFVQFDRPNVRVYSETVAHGVPSPFYSNILRTVIFAICI
jgi:hypothetical protein